MLSDDCRRLGGGVANLGGVGVFSLGLSGRSRGTAGGGGSGRSDDWVDDPDGWIARCVGEGRDFSLPLSTGAGTELEGRPSPTPRPICAAVRGLTGLAVGVEIG